MAAIESAFVLCGGLGTRVAGQLGDVPKFLAPVGRRCFADLVFEVLARSGVRRVVLGTGHLAEAIERYVAARPPSDLEVTLSREPTPLGTGGALKLASKLLRDGPFFVLNGDSLATIPLASLTALHQARGAVASLALLHVPDAARFGAVRFEASGAVTHFDEKGAVGPGWVNAGIYLLEPSVLDLVPEGRSVSLERDVFPELIGRGLFGCALAGEFLDIGTPESLAAAETFFRGWDAPAERRRLALVDRDGTIIEERNYLSSPAEVRLLPNAAAAIRRLADAGYVVAVVSNQSGIARGYFDAAALDAVEREVARQLAEAGATVGGFFVCPHGPSDDCACRKPLPGLALRAASALGVDLADAIVVGDKACDVDLGRAIGAQAILVRTGWGSRDEADVRARATHVADDLLGAVEWSLGRGER